VGAGASIRRISAEDAAIQLAYASKVIIVPGYGLAAAQAQHEAAELAVLLQEHATVFFAIHPVAGRMPGHMNVLLAEANVPYTDLKEMDAANPEFPTADVALVVGANDVTNPAARRPGNPVSGMPILNVDQAKSVIVIKRSMGHGWAMATPGSTTSCTSTRRPACCSPTRRPAWPRSLLRSRPWSPADVTNEHCGRSGRAGMK
jgi:NAD(P) transhydrogenase subunit beta